MAFFSCGGSSLSDVLVDVSGVPTAATALSVLAKLNGQAAMSPMSFMTPISQFGVSLPASDNGPLELDLTATDTNNCTVGNGTVTTQLPTELISSPLMAAITAVSPPQCGTPKGCAAGTICPYTPLPQKLNDLTNLWAISPSNIWAVGAGGVILNYNGTSWSTVPSGTTETLESVWASGPNDVWAVGGSQVNENGIILHNTGSGFSPVSSGSTLNVNGIFGLAPNNIWAVGDANGGAGYFAHWDGTSFTKLSNTVSGTLYGVWAASSTQIFACGLAGVIISTDGSTFTKVPSGTSQDLISMWGMSANQIFAVGSGGALVGYNGSTWQQLSAGGTSTSLNSVFGDGTNVFAVGSNGAILHSTSPFTTFTTYASVPNTKLYGVQSTSSGVGWVAGQSGFLGTFDSNP